MSQRLTENHIKSLYMNNDYMGLPLLPNCYPYLNGYLERCRFVMLHALTRYPCVTGIRFDLHYPADYPLADDDFNNLAVRRFIKILRERIERDQLMASREGKRVHMTELDYVWVREFGETHRPHYHVMIFLNNQAFMSLGNPSLDHDNMAKRIRESWSKALRADYHIGKHRVHFPDHCSHCIHRYDQQSIDNAFLALSYLCKEHSKQYRTSSHSIGSSHLSGE